MNNERHEENLLERGLAAWDVPETPIGLTDRILAHNAETLAGLSQPARPSPKPSPKPSEQSEPLPMHPTQPRITSSARPFWTATLIGFAAAAALLLAFTAGRESTSTPQVATPVLPKVEIQVMAPPPVAAPVAPPAPPAPPAPEVAPLPPERTTTERTTTEPATTEPATQGLKNPFGDSPRKSKHRRGTNSVVYIEETSRDLENPFDDDDVELSVLRIGVTAGTKPARVFVDGVEVGSTPLARYEVTPGRHKIKFVWGSGRIVTKFVDVAAGSSVVVRGG